MFCFECFLCLLPNITSCCFFFWFCLNLLFIYLSFAQSFRSAFWCLLARTLPHERVLQHCCNRKLGKGKVSRIYPDIMKNIVERWYSLNKALAFCKDTTWGKMQIAPMIYNIVMTTSQEKIYCWHFPGIVPTFSLCLEQELGQPNPILGPQYSHPLPTQFFFLPAFPPPLI